jgi:hypothetical protein
MSDQNAQNTPSVPNSVVGSSREILLQYTHCSACKARLHFTYVTDFSRNLTQESARCPECHLQSHKVMHRLQ